MGPNNRQDICIVATDNYIYFLGGWPENTWRTWRIVDPWRMADAEKYDLRTNTWDKIAYLQEPRAGASGAAANGKIFVYGDYFAEMEQRPVTITRTNLRNVLRGIK